MLLGRYYKNAILGTVSILGLGDKDLVIATVETVIVM
jgi:hypothetical protein